MSLDIRVPVTARLFAGVKAGVRNRFLLIGGSIMIALIAIIVLGQWFSPYGPLEMNTMNRLAAPSADHWFGTDNFGRDIFTRVAFGGTTTLAVGFSVALGAAIVGLCLGLYSTEHRTADMIIMRICDGLMSIPTVFLAIALVGAFGPSMLNVIVALTIVFSPYVARVVRSSALVVRELTFIEAIRSQGASRTRVLWLHIMPNTVPVMIVQASFIFADAVLVEAALSFLGAGVPPPQPSWGNMVYEAKVFLYDAPWAVFFPGIMIVLIILALNMMGDGLRDELDPNLRGVR